MLELDDFTAAYLACALWTSTTPNDVPLDGMYDVDDIDPESLAEHLADVHTWRDAYRPLWAAIDGAEWYNDAQAGHDLWLTRNGHGVGFWDRDIGDVGDTLTTLAEKEGPADLYAGDDGKLYFA